MEIHMGFLKKLKVELPYDPATPLLGIFLKESKSAYYIQRYLHSSTVHNGEVMESA
jgi:hypothetical protein